VGAHMAVVVVELPPSHSPLLQRVEFAFDSKILLQVGQRVLESLRPRLGAWGRARRGAGGAAGGFQATRALASSTLPCCMSSAKRICRSSVILFLIRPRAFSNVPSLYCGAMESRKVFT